MQAIKVNILRNFSVFLLVLFFNVPASANLEAVAKMDAIPVFCNEPVSLIVTVSWRGHQSDYRVGVPEMVLPEGIVRTGVASTSFRDADMFHIVYTCRLEAHECGEFSIDSIEIDYLSKDKEETFTKRISGPSFVVEKTPLLSEAMLWTGAGVAGTGLVAIACLIPAWRKKRRRSVTMNRAVMTDEVLRAWQDRLEHCRKLKAHGEVQQFYDEAFRLYQEINNRLPDSHGADTMMERFARLVDEVKYGGVKPHSSETEASFRALERMVQDVSNR